MRCFLTSLGIVLISPFCGVSNLYAQEGDVVSLQHRLETQQGRITTLYLAVGVLLLICLFLAYRNYLQRKKADVIIQAEKDEAAQQRSRAERVERMEQKFVASVSHEIRTPMNTVLGMTDLTLDTQLTAKQKSYLTAVKKSSENLLVIISDVLERSVQETPPQNEQKQFRLSEQVNAVIEAMQPLMQHKHLVLEPHIAHDVPDLLTGDTVRLGQVLANLCENAIRATDKGVIKITVDKVPGTESTLCFKVIDPGVGLGVDVVGNLIESFHNTHPDTWQKYEGSDVNLSIAKTLVEMEGGEIEVKGGQGSGSEFAFTITYGLADERAALSLRGIRILVAEDNEYNQVVITDTLETLIQDVRVDLAENGQIAVKKLMTGDYDLILMDVQMPELNGLEATHFIRNLKDARHAIPIIALTAGVMNAELKECYEAGMNDCIPKPFTRTHLLNTLTKYYPAPATVTSRTQDANKVTDLGFLQDFCVGDKTLMKKYIDIYLKLTPNNLEKIDNAMGAQDYALLGRTVHAMKAHLNYMGMKPTRKIAESIELCAREQGDLAELPQLISKLRSDCEQSIEELGHFNAPAS